MTTADAFHRIVRAVGGLPKFSAYHVAANVVDPDHVELSVSGPLTPAADTDTRWDLLDELRWRALAVPFVVTEVEEADDKPLFVARFERTSAALLAGDPSVEILTLCGPPPPLDE